MDTSNTSTSNTSNSSNSSNSGNSGNTTVTTQDAPAEWGDMAALAEDAGLVVRPYTEREMGLRNGCWLLCVLDWIVDQHVQRPAPLQGSLREADLEMLRQQLEQATEYAALDLMQFGCTLSVHMDAGKKKLKRQKPISLAEVQRTYRMACESLQSYARAKQDFDIRSKAVEGVMSPNSSGAVRYAAP